VGQCWEPLQLLIPSRLPSIPPKEGDFLPPPSPGIPTYISGTKIPLHRLALLQKWREKYGPNATYRNLAKSFYDASKPDLVETVCVVMTCDYPK